MNRSPIRCAAVAALLLAPVALGAEFRDGGAAAIGARARLEGIPALSRASRTDGSYASASDPRVLFGLGDDADARFVRVRWPDGEEDRFGPLEVGRYHVLQRTREPR